MKKQFIAILSCLLFTAGGCTKTKSENTEHYNIGPIEESEEYTDDEKTLMMIQQCINDYNINRIPEIEEQLNTTLPKIPLELEGLPEIQSLGDLEEIKDDESTTNTYYVGSYKVNDRYKVIFNIYEPSTNSFWFNGSIKFQIDPDLVEKNKYSGYTQELTNLLSNEDSVLTMLYGINVTMDSTEADGYYKVNSINGKKISSIAEIKSEAEKVFTEETLESTYYPAAFEGNTPVYKEINGSLYSIPVQLTTQLHKFTYEPQYIISVYEHDNIVEIDLLSSVMGNIQPDIKRIELSKTENGYRLMEAY